MAAHKSAHSQEFNSRVIVSIVHLKVQRKIIHAFIHSQECIPAMKFTLQS